LDCEHRTPPASDGGYPYIAIPQIKQGRLDLAEVRRITPEHYVDWTRKAKPQPYDVILSRRCNPGETAFVPPGLECALGQNLVLLRADGTKVFPPFLRWLVRGPEWWEQIGNFINVGAVFDSLKCADIPNFRLTIPPLPQQRATARILGTLDDKIELNRRMNETLEAIARAIFKSWFVDFDPVRAKMAGRKPEGMDAATAKLFPDGFEDSELGPIPRGWRVGQVRDTCEKIENGGTPSRHVEAYWEPPEVPWLTSGEVRDRFVVRTENFISNRGLQNSSAKKWPRFTSVVALYGATAGYATLLGAELCANQACCALVPLLEATSFNFLLVSSSLGHFQQQTRGSAQQNLSQSIVADLPTVVPPKSVLGAFDRRVRELLSRCLQNLHESFTLAALRDALLPKLLSGKLRVPDAERIAGRCLR